MQLPARSCNDGWFFTTAYTNTQLRQYAIAIYILYRTVNHLRHVGRTTEEYKNHFMNQLVHEATRGDQRCRRDLGAARARAFLRRRPRSPDDHGAGRRVARRRGAAD